VRVSRWFTGLAASFVVFAFLRDGTMETLISNAASGARTLSRGGGRIVRKGLS
jgi:hypothetical protein